MTQDRPLNRYPSGLDEDPGAPAPLFLKLSWVGFAIFGVAYFFLYFSGNGSELVQLYNQLTAG